jgi:hypothetical protein
MGGPMETHRLEEPFLSAPNQLWAQLSRSSGLPDRVVIPHVLQVLTK